MRLLDTLTGHFVEKDARDRKTQYAILSHTWDSRGEQIYQELRDIQKRYPSNFSTSSHLPPEDGPSPTRLPSQPSHDSPPLTPVALASASSLEQSETTHSPIWTDSKLSPKIRDACAVARANGYRYIWIDSCCIDKTSSSELSESINSMYLWYTRADVCFTFLADVPAEEDHQREGSRFRRSRWFTRGWTLQELIAPARVVFFSSEWRLIGSKHSLAALVTEITNISSDALLHLEPLREFSVAQRLSWASKRETTRVEDQAYSLLGIFDINMSTLYGEGDRALRRLQEEIMQRIPDQSLFAWGGAYLGSQRLSRLDTVALRQMFRRVVCEEDHANFGGLRPSLLSPSLDVFEGCGNIRAVAHDEVVRRLQHYPDLPAGDYTFTAHGIRTTVPVIPLSRYLPASTATECSPATPLSQWYLLILGCEHKDLPGHLLGRVCYIPHSESNVELLYCGSVYVESQYAESQPALPEGYHGLLPFALTRTTPTLSSQQIDSKMVYIPHPYHDEAFEVARWKPHETINLVLTTKMREALQAQGYAAGLRGPDQDHPISHRLTLSNDIHTITMEYEHLIRDGNDARGPSQSLSINAHIEVDSPFRFKMATPETVSWTDSCPWGQKLGRHRINVFTSGRGTSGPNVHVNKYFDLDLTFATTDHYILRVEILDAPTGTSSPSPSLLEQPRPANRRWWEKLTERLAPSRLPVRKRGLPYRWVASPADRAPSSKSGDGRGTEGANVERQEDP